MHKIKKSELVWMNNHTCVHGHTYISHYNCYLLENPGNGRIGYFDIETSNLKANMGIVYSYCIKDSKSDKIYERCITKKEILSKDIDKPVIKQMIEDLKKFDRIVTYYGTRFDIPFIRTRAMIHDLPFPAYGDMIHTDLYFIVRNKFQLTRNSLAVACAVLLGDSFKTMIDYTYWMRAMQGDEKALGYILEHNRYDVIDTERLYNKVIDFKKYSETSA